jgi:NAD(P)H-hydrate epimerase
MSATPLYPVVTAAQARALDARTISGLPDSYTLMHRAASAAVAWLDTRVERSAAVFVGPGNNGGDGWLIAGLLRERGWQVAVYAAGDPRTPDAQRAKTEAEQGGAFAPVRGGEALVLDALLGTGATGAPRGAIAQAMQAMCTHAGTMIAIDIPSALDATTGDDHGAAPAAHTLTFGSVKRGHLLRRELIGTLHLLDIGLGAPDADVPQLVDARIMPAWLPGLAPDAWKGTRRRVAIVGGDEGMAGAVILAARGAHVAGAGMVRTQVAAASMTAVQVAAPFATALAWRAHDYTAADPAWPHALVIGPGLDGTGAQVRDGVLRLLHAFPGPVLLDAGALTAFAHRPRRPVDEGDDTDPGSDDHLQALGAALRGRPALLTPHLGEFNRLDATGTAPSDRFEGPARLARTLNATVLLKGVPTVIAAPDGTTLVTATGNQALAMGGSGDVLSGIAGALLAQGLSPLHAGAVAAIAHGVAAEQAVRAIGGWRGVTMDLLLQRLSQVWNADVAAASLSTHSAPLLLTLPPVSAR